MASCKLKLYRAVDMAALRWSGFTEDDIRKIREDNGYTSSDSDTCPAPPQSPPCPRVKQVTFGVSPNKKTVAKKSSLRSPSQKFATNNGDSVLDPKEMLSPPKDVSKFETCEAKQVRLAKHHTRMPANEDSRTLSPINGMPVVKLRVKSDGHSVEVLATQKKMSAKPKVKPDKNTNCQTNDDVSEASRYGENSPHEDSADHHLEFNSTKKKLTLEEFQIRQKMIEEQNKRRRAMLSKAISDRKKKTQAETEKLTHIQKELQKLDSLVSNDVSILRDQIEVASMEFNEVQKRYEKAEREFVEAKIDLFKKMERKEQLTEYLCTIIEENEMRKSRKLAELMYELELESLIEQCHETAPVLPQLCALNDVAYKCCTTLRDPNALQTPPLHEECDDIISSSPTPLDTERADEPGSCTESADELPETLVRTSDENEPGLTNSDVISDAAAAVEDGNHVQISAGDVDGKSDLEE